MKRSTRLYNRSLVARHSLILLILNAAFALCLNARNTTWVRQTDSLQNVLRQTNLPEEKIAALQELTFLYWQQPEEVPYLTELLALSFRTNTIDLTYKTLGNLCRHYYNKENMDSLLYWKSHIDSLSHRRNEYPEAVFRAGSNVCQLYLGQGDYELAMNEAVKMLQLAKNKQNAYGMIRANQNLGVIYQAIHCDDDAMVAFREGMEWLKKAPDADLEFQFLINMISSSLRLSFYDETEKLLQQYKTVLMVVERPYKKKGVAYPVKWVYWLIDSYYAEYYVCTNHLAKARAHLDKATQAANATQDEVMKYPYYQAKALYYKKKGDYPVTLEFIEKALKNDYRTDMLKIKIEVLKAVGRLQEAMAVCDEVLAKNDEIRNNAFTRQMNQLRTLNNLNDRETQERELAYQNEQIVIKHYQLAGSVVVVLILLVLLYILSQYYIRTRRLRDELLREQGSLIASEQEYRQAKEEAEEANRMKTTFIANISHEVRTPLNAIVGFSELLADDSCSEEERIQFAGLVTVNSELLLNLVNNVLDLSRLESGKLRFNLMPVDLIACCREALSTVPHRMTKEVRLTFTPGRTPYTLNTDPLRLQQLLENLLYNAAKFTRQGEINLSFEEDEEKDQLRFVVTDTGCGIPQDKQKRIFERFEKIDDFIQGTGLGLSICKIIASRFGGSITIDSSYTAGARFVFIHPRSLTEDWI